MATKQAEADRLTAEISSHEARNQGGGASLRGEYQALEKAVAVLRRERENLQQDLEISTMNPKEVGMMVFCYLILFSLFTNTMVGEGGGHSSVSCLCHFPIDHASLSRRSIVATLRRYTSNIWDFLSLQLLRTP